MTFSKCHVTSCIVVQTMMLVSCLASESRGAGLNECMNIERERMFYRNKLYISKNSMIVFPKTFSSVEPVLVK